MPIGLISMLPVLALAVWLTLRQMKNEENSWFETTWRCKLPGGSFIERGAIRIGWAKYLKICTSLQWKTGCYIQRMKNAEKLRKNACQNYLNMVLYVSAKRWDKRMTSEVSARSLWKEPIDVQKHQLVLRCWERSKFRKVQRLRKKDLTKNHFGGKINRSSAERLRRTGPWKLNNIERTCNGTYFRVGKTR